MSEKWLDQEMSKKRVSFFPFKTVLINSASQCYSGQIGIRNAIRGLNQNPSLLAIRVIRAAFITDITSRD